MTASAVETTAEAPVVRTTIEESFIRTILSPYISKDCIYLKSAETTPGGSGASIRATFAIPESCYIDSTGHFNAVELNICYNQMFYVLVADSVRRSAIPEMHDWTMDRFLDRRLPGMLIARLSSRFSRPIDATSFWAEGTIHRMSRRREGKLIFLETSAKFGDDKGGQAAGDFSFAIVS